MDNVYAVIDHIVPGVNLYATFEVAQANMLSEMEQCGAGEEMLRVFRDMTQNTFDGSWEVEWENDIYDMFRISLEFMPINIK